MDWQQIVLFAILGLGAGSLVAGIAIGIVLFYRGSGIINLSTGAVAMLAGYCYWSLRTGTAPWGSPPAFGASEGGYLSTGPALVVIPGEIKSNNATFVQRFLPNNIADFGELELSQANFTVLERSNLGALLQEISLAYNLGDVDKARKMMQVGKLKATKWIVKFDILKAEQIAENSQGFDGRPLGSIIGILGGNRGSAAADVPTALPRSAVIRERGQTDQRGEPAAGGGAELRQSGEEGDRGHRAAADAAHPGARFCPADELFAP